MLSRFLRWIEEKRALRVVHILKPHIRGATLDVGCWNGDVAKRLDHEDIIGIDIVDPPQPQIEVRRFDGVHIPFDDQQFDTVLCCAVLHHTEDQCALMEEMKRVGKRIVVLEDAYNHAFDKMSVISLHAIGSRLLGMPYRISGFKSDAGWRKFFNEHGLSIEAASKHPGAQPLWLFLRHHLYILANSNGERDGQV